MKKRVFLLFFFFFVCLSINAQNIKGRVLSLEDEKPLSGVSVKIIVADSLYDGFTTDSKGYFQKSIELTNYKLIFSYLGYDENTLFVKNEESKNIDLGTVSLSPASIELENVEVTAASKMYQADKIVAFPTKQQLKASSSGLDLLKYLLLPGLFVDPVQENISIEGTSGVIYRINGIKATLQEVKALKPEQVARVDYKQIPSIRELDSNSGTLDFILKQSQTGTFLATNLLSAVSTGMLNGSLNLKTNYKKSQFSLDYNVNWRDYSKRKLDETESFRFPEKVLTWDKQGEYAPFGYLQQIIGAGYLYQGEKDILNIRFDNTIFAQHDQNLMTIYQNYNKLLSRNICSDFSNYMPSLDVTYNRKIDDKQGIEVNLVGTLMNTEYNRSLVDVYTDGYSSDIYNYTDGDRKSIIGEAFYWKNGEKVNFSAGLKTSYGYTNNMYADNTQAQIKKFDLYPYIQFSGKVKNISYTIGTGVKYLRQEDGIRRSDYFKNLSTLSLYYSKKYWNVRYSLGYTPSYPSLGNLSDVIQRIDTFSMIKGNPSLKPYESLSNQINLTVTDQKRIISVLTLKANNNFSPIHQDIYYSPDYRMFVYENRNQITDRVLGAQLLFQMSSILKLFTFQVFGGWNNYLSKGVLYSHTYNDFYYGFYVAMQYKNFNLNGTWRKPQKVLSGQFLSLMENYSSISMSYKMKSLTIGAGLQFPFAEGSKYGEERLSTDSWSNKKILIKNNANMFYMSVSYNINWGRSVFNLKKRLNNGDYDNGVLRVNDN